MMSTGSQGFAGWARMCLWCEPSNACLDVHVWLPVMLGAQVCAGAYVGVSVSVCAQQRRVRPGSLSAALTGGLQHRNPWLPWGSAVGGSAGG